MKPPPELFNTIYAELRALAAHYLKSERADHTLQPTALVHEAYLRLAEGGTVDFRDRAQLIGLVAGVMRHVLVDHARGKNAVKRGGGQGRVRIATGLLEAGDEEVDMIALDEALSRLGALDERQERIVVLRFFGGLSVEQAAGILGVSPRTVEMDWSMARAWLRRELSARE